MFTYVDGFDRVNSVPEASVVWALNFSVQLKHEASAHTGLYSGSLELKWGNF